MKGLSYKFKNSEWVSLKIGIVDDDVQHIYEKYYIYVVLYCISIVRWANNPLRKKGLLRIAQLLPRNKTDCQGFAPGTQ